MNPDRWFSVHILIALIILITLTQVIFLGTVIFLENRDPAKTMIWLMILGILPLIGAVLYLTFGRVIRKKQLSHHQQIRQEQIDKILHYHPVRVKAEDFSKEVHSPLRQKLARLLFNADFAPLTANNRSEVLTNGEETFKSLFQALEKAKEHIHLEYYIFKDDEIGQNLLDLLVKKATLGVNVRILLDGWGSRAIAKHCAKLRQSGIQLEWFYPVRFPFFSSRLNFRNHRKIVVIDGRIGFLGGLNVGDEYLSRSKKYGFWRDTFLKLEGEAVHFLQVVFLNDWNSVTGEELRGVKFYPESEKYAEQLIQIAASGPDADWESALHIFFAALSGAEKSIFLATPYFIPDESTLMVLKTAALSGLDVRILFQGIPDHKITFWASHSYFEELLEVGVRIYRYQKGILHAKILILDGEIGGLGSTNFDMRSFQLNFEITAFVYDPVFAKRLERDFHQDILDSQEIVYEDYVKRPFAHRLKESWARLFSPLL